jgi:hypothetical protein
MTTKKGASRVDTLPPQPVLVRLRGSESDGVPFLFDRRKVDEYRLWVFTADDAPPPVRGVLNAFDTIKAEGKLKHYRVKVDDAFRWRFPNETYVLRLPVAAALLQRYTPDYQQRNVEVQLASHTLRLAAVREFVIAAPSSPAGQAIEQWWQANSALPIFGEPHRSFDAELSALGTMIVRTLVEYDSLRAMHSSHKSLLLAQLAATTPYRARVDSGNSLLLHFIICGPAQNTKSFVLDELVALSIPGTVDVVTRSTAAATDTDTDEVDRVKVMHELPNEVLLAVPKTKKVPEVQVKWKSILTSGEAVTEVFTVAEGGVRTTRKSVSEKRFSLIGATNVAPNEIDAAMRSRLIVVHASEQAANARADCAFEDKLHGEQSDRAVLAESQAFVNRSRRMQALIYYLENTIGAGVLHDVTLAVTSLVIRSYRRVLHFRFAVSMSRRSSTSLVSWCCVVRCTGCSMHRAAARSPSGISLCSTRGSATMKSAPTWRSICSPSNGSIRCTSRCCMHCAKCRQQTAAWRRMTSCSSLTRLDRPSPMQTMLRCTTRIQRSQFVVRHCRTALGVTTTRGEVSKLIRSLCEKRIRAATYNWRKSGDSHQMYTSAVPVVPAVMTDVAPLQLVGGDRRVLVHRAWLEGTHDDVHESAIAACFSAYTPAAKFATGKPISPSMPQVFAVRKVRPNEQVVQFQSEALSADARLILQLPAAATRTDDEDNDDSDDGDDLDENEDAREVVRLSESYDDYCTKKRLAALGIEATRQNVVRFHPRIALAIPGAGDGRELVYFCVL